MPCSILLAAALLFGTALGVPFKPLSIRNFDQHMCTLHGSTSLEITAPEATGESGGGVSSSSISWEMLLFNEAGLRFWTCVNEGKCNPRAMGGRTISKGMTKTNTDVFWEPYGNSLSQCRCIVDGKTYEGVVDSEITHGTINESQQGCSCTYSCNTGFGDKVGVWFWEDPDYTGVSRKTYLQPDYCCEYSFREVYCALIFCDRRFEGRSPR
jgi:hypothetical protein